MPYCPFRHFPHPVAQVGFVRLACLIHAANVRSEPGSNPSKSCCLSGELPLPVSTASPGSFSRASAFGGEAVEISASKSLRSPFDRLKELEATTGRSCCLQGLRL